MTTALTAMDWVDPERPLHGNLGRGTDRQFVAESTRSVVLPQSGLSRPAGASQPPAGLWAEKTFRAQVI
jgi:hypothetical protein